MSSRAALCAVRGARRMFNTSTTARSGKEVDRGYKTIRPTQEKYNVEDQHIHVKGGGLDQLFYKGTMLTCLGGLAYNAMLYLKLSFNK